jgi:K+-transporting ATPase A subunit
VAILLGWAIVQLIALPFGGIGTGVSFFWGFLLVCVVVGGLILFGRRRQRAARERAAEQRAAQFKR